jgi:hypothetical protein
LAAPKKSDDEPFSAKEAQERFEAALKAGLKTPPKPLKEISPKRTKPKRKSRSPGKA